MSGVKPRNVGGAYRRVLVDGREWSKHTNDFLAADSANDVGIAALDHLARGIISRFPLIEIDGGARVVYEPDPDDTTIELPPEYMPPTSDGGLDLVDFLDQQFPYQGGGTVLPDGTSLEVLQKTAADVSKQPGKWLFVPLRTLDAAGKSTLIGAAWRGYVFMYLWRDRTAIRIGLGG